MRDLISRQDEYIEKSKQMRTYMKGLDIWIDRFNALHRKGEKHERPYKQTGCD